MEQDESKGAAAVYVSWTTLKNAIDGFSQGVPNQIDRTVFPGMAGGVQNQLFAGLKFLGLMDEKSKPTATLHALVVPDEETRREKVKALLMERYPAIFALGLLKATPGQLAEEMSKSYNVTGDTRDKAVRFFLGAAEYAGIGLSPLLKPKTARNGSQVKRRRVKRVGASDGPEEIPDPGMAAPLGTSRTVTLKSGGTLTLAVSLDVLRLPRDDREFVFGLIDKLEEYEAEGDGDEDHETDGKGGDE